jgi:hypothetical protein
MSVSEWRLGPNHPDYGWAVADAPAPEARVSAIQGPRRTLVLLAPPSPSILPISFAPRDQVIARCPQCAHVFWTVNTRQRFCCLACADGGPTDAD